jgi:hypothetical protein
MIHPLEPKMTLLARHPVKDCPPKRAKGQIAVSDVCAPVAGSFLPWTDHNVVVQDALMWVCLNVVYFVGCWYIYYTYCRRALCFHAQDQMGIREKSVR